MTKQKSFREVPRCKPKSQRATLSSSKKMKQRGIFSLGIPGWYKDCSKTEDSFIYWYTPDIYADGEII